MLNIVFEKTCKRYVYEWIFRDINLSINYGSKWGIIGPNGSGKSTFIKLLLGTIDPSQGSIHFNSKQKKIDAANVFNHFSFSAPYMDLIENYSIKELYRFHYGFKQPILKISFKEFAEICYLDKHKNKRIKNYSSGMKQRLKLAFALLSESSVIVLDEPTTNLDLEGKKWFHQLVNEYLMGRTLIIASNEPSDLTLIDHKLNILNYK